MTYILYFYFSIERKKKLSSPYNVIMPRSYKMYTTSKWYYLYSKYLFYIFVFKMKKIILLFLQYCGISPEKLQYYGVENLSVHGSCNFGLKTAAIDEICLRYNDTRYLSMPPPPKRILSCLSTSMQQFPCDEIRQRKKIS